MKCQIQWIDDKGNPTPDENEAVGHVYVEEHVYIRPDGTGVKIDRSKDFGICADHLKRFHDDHLLGHNWVFVPSEQK